MYLNLVRDVSRTAGRGGIRLTCQDDAGWGYATFGLPWKEADWAAGKLGIASREAYLKGPVAALHRVFASPDDVAEAAEQLLHRRHTPTSRLPHGLAAGLDDDWPELAERCYGKRNTVSAGCTTRTTRRDGQGAPAHIGTKTIPFVRNLRR
jgi:hypothetical protein